MSRILIVDRESQKIGRKRLKTLKAEEARGAHLHFGVLCLLSLLRPKVLANGVMNEPQIRQLCATVREVSLAAHRFLRHGHCEKIYENSLANRLRKLGLNVRSQHPVSVYDEDGSLLGDFFADLLLEEELILELKAVRHLADEHTAQVLGYLRASRLEHAMLINFGAPVIQFKKFIFNDAYGSP